MINQELRKARFTSSENWKLLTQPTAAAKKEGAVFGKPALTYIKTKRYEKRLGRSISNDVTAKSLSWGNLVEGRIFSLMGTDCSLNSADTMVHPDYDSWAGSPDGFRYGEQKAVQDFKCPLTLLSFCDLVEPLYAGLNGMEAMNYIRENHSSGEDYFQQLVSNACISKVDWAELIIYMPYESELSDIKMLAADAPANDLSKYYWIVMANDGELPSIPDDGFYKNINIIRFKVPEDDKAKMESAIIKATALLNAD